MDRVFTDFRYRNADYRISCEKPEIMIAAVKAARQSLEAYIKVRPEFASSYVPIDEDPEAPEIARRMLAASHAAGTGPMAAVAGAICWAAVNAALDAGCREAVIDNGGDVFAASKEELVIGLFPGSQYGAIGIKVMPEEMPIAACSSSSKMGHSDSFGDCDLACVISHDPFFADAGATGAANRVSTRDDIPRALEYLSSIKEIQSALIFQEGKIGKVGPVPGLVKLAPKTIKHKIVKAPGWVI
ncbi:MAG: UPF0280 family protein [Spirochaetia bacterium]